MPTYTFRCRKCKTTVVVEHSMTAEHPKTHKGCGGTLTRVFDSQCDPIYKGAGFFHTDSRLDPKEDEN